MVARQPNQPKVLGCKGYIEMCIVTDASNNTSLVASLPLNMNVLKTTVTTQQMS